MAFVFNILEVGSDVVVSGSGTINTTSFGSSTAAPSTSNLNAGLAELLLTTGGSGKRYSGITGPNNFGPGGVDASPLTVGGDIVGVHGFFQSIYVPNSYISGDPLSNNALFFNRTFSTLGLTAGSYTYTWGSGASADSLTVNVGPTPSSTINAPLPFSWFSTGVNATGVVTTTSVTGSFAGFTVVSGSATFTGLKDAYGNILSTPSNPMIISSGITYPMFVTSASLSSGAVLFYL
jgi:hypothetical protein